MALCGPRRSGLGAAPRTGSVLSLCSVLLLLLALPSLAAGDADAGDTAPDAATDASSTPQHEPGSAGAPDFLKDWVRALLDDGSVPGVQEGAYEPDFGVFSRDILGRAVPGVTSLANNAPEQLNADPGSTTVFVYEASTEEEVAELRRREDEADETDTDETGEGIVRRATRRLIYLSANTCIQPLPLNETTSARAPQLTMYVSTSAENTAPGPDSNSTEQTVHAFTEGAVMVALNTTEDVYVGIHAPNVSSTALSGIYNFQVAVSTDEYYHSYDNQTDANLVWVDSDASASLLITHNLTDNYDAERDAALMATAPYGMFAQNTKYAAIDGVRFSYCGLQNYAQIAATKAEQLATIVRTGMTRTGLGNLPKQQFYFSGLNASSSYTGILALLPGNGSGRVGDAVAGGGGKVSRETSFATKSATTQCEVVFNLTFCNETAYAVPSNPTRFANATLLADAYDAYARDMFDKFSKNLAQVPCEAPDTQKYSLARGCADCAAAYKSWLCSVVMPRCTDFEDDSSYLQPRAVAQPFPNGTFLAPDVAAAFPNTTAYNSSRNAFIDATIAPGPYKEVLPCADLCYGLVQSCPASFGFSCPRPQLTGFDTSYGQRATEAQNGLVTCNYPGSAHFFSGAPVASWSAGAVVLALAVMAVFL